MTAENAGGGVMPARRENVLTHKLGPLPTWGWIAIAGGAFLAYRWYSSKNAAASGGTTSSSAVDTSANTVPQFVNQTYVSTSAPLSPTTAASSGGAPSSVGTPTNPAPVGSSTQPKPTTTLSQWTYPAPTGLQAYDLTSKGTRLSWNAVTGPGGQHPNSYTVATYDSKRKLVDQFQTTAGNTNTAEYGKGGKGLPKGTYDTHVWANGGPVAPPHANVQYTLKG